MERLTAQIYNFDNTLAPEGKTLITFLIPTDFDYWERLHEQPKLYQKRKDEVLAHVIAALEGRYPGIGKEIEMTDVATPVTYNYRTGCYRGSYEGWLPSMESSGVRIKKTIHGIDNFYLAGQWVEIGGGLPTAAFTARNAIQLICNQDGQDFNTTVVEE